MDSQEARAVLGVKPEARPDEVKTAYRRLALELHPDRGASDGAQFGRINEAYNTLKSESASPVQQELRRGQSAPRRPSRWGPPDSGTPEQDWSKYTSGFEDKNPEFWKEYERRFWQEYNDTINADGRNGEYEKAKEPKQRPHISVKVDPSLCIACQSCETMAPDVFHIDTESQMNPKSRVINQHGAGYNTIMNAAQTCPTKAIIIEDEDKKARLYPF